MHDEDLDVCGSWVMDPDSRSFTGPVDPVNHPPHYTSGKVECIDAIESALSEEEFRGFCRGNAMKYVFRAGKKGDFQEDIQKAAWYLNRVSGE